jgi:hypothetical protein
MESWFYKHQDWSGWLTASGDDCERWIRDRLEGYRFVCFDGPVRWDSAFAVFVIAGR